eukprot:scaffold119028_cov13-Tisochrysis_lutea.AAC.1
MSPFHHVHKAHALLPPHGINHRKKLGLAWPGNGPISNGYRAAGLLQSPQTETPSACGAVNRLAQHQQPFNCTPHLSS